MSLDLDLAPIENRDEWWTPDDLFDEISNKFGPFTLDAAATAQNSKCDRFFSVADDALCQPWDGRVWCNPPYRNLIKWVRKAWYEVNRSGGAELVVLLLPAQTSTRWFHDYALPHAELYWVRGKRRFGGAKWNAILEGRKTQTRRVIKPQPTDWTASHYANSKIRTHDLEDQETGVRYGFGFEDEERSWKCPYGKPGDRLWVREKFLVEVPGDYRYDAEGIPPGEYPAHLQKESIVHYAATNTLKTLGAWKPSIHMPRWASRITLEIVSVRVERLNDISEDDAGAEGVDPWKVLDCTGVSLSCRVAFANLWESINGIDSWKANPWVWVVEFKKVNP